MPEKVDVLEKSNRSSVGFGELLGCPFCGNKLKRISKTQHSIKHKDNCFIVSLYMGVTKQTIINVADLEKWKTRAT